MVALILATLMTAAPLRAASDPVTASIEQAQALALKKNRRQACALLQKALANTPTAIRGRAKLSESLASIAKVFFTDKGQRAYESGQSLWFEEPETALTQMREALQLEDHNVLVLAGIARVQLLKQDCAGALVTLGQAREVNPYSAELALLELRSYACQQNFELLREKALGLSGLTKWEEVYSKYLLSQDHLQQNQPKRAHDLLTKVTEEFPQFPEAYYYLVRAGEALGKDSEGAMSRYLSLCKAVTAQERRKYALEPRLCANVKEVENELAKRNREP